MSSWSAALLATLLWSAATQPQAIGVFPDGRVEAWDLTQELEGDAAPVHLWIWSATSPPQRHLTSDLRSEPRELSPASRWVQVSLLTPEVGEQRYRLYTAPVEMWAEIPEPLLPGWEMDATSQVSLPVAPDGSWRLRAVGEDAASRWADVAGGSSAVDLPVTSAVSASTVLVTEGGALLPMAETRLWRVSGPFAVRETVALWRAGGDGLLTLPAMPRSAPLDLWFEASNVVPRGLQTTPDTLPETIVLASGLTLQGVVLEPDGSVIAGARIDYETWLPGDGSELLHRTAASDEQGTWRLSGVAAGAFSLRVGATGFAPTIQTYPAVVREAPVRVVLSPAASRRVEVYDDVGTPVVGAGITATGGVTAVTGEEGSAVLAPVAGDRSLTLRVDAARHLPSKTVHRLPLPEPIVVSLKRALHVRGRFVSSEGTPVEGGSLVVESGGGLRRLELGDDAEFAFDQPSGVEATLHLAGADSSSLIWRLEAGEAGEVRELGDLEAPRALRIEGRVVDAVSHRPVAGAVVTFEGERTAGPFAALGLGSEKARSGADGTFSLGGSSSEGTLWVEMPERALASVTVRPLRGHEAVAVGDVVLSPGATVRVHSPNIADRATAKIEIGRDREIFAPFADGTAALEHVPAGRWVLAVSTPGAETCRRPLEIPVAGLVDVECRPDTVHVRGIAVADGQPVGTGHLIWLSERRTERPATVLHRRSASGLPHTSGSATGPPQVNVNVDSDGSFETSLLRPGRWQVAWVASGGDDSVGPVWVEVPAGEDWRPVLELSPLAAGQPSSTGHHCGG